MPPPCCMVSAASRRCSKMPPMSSGMVAHDEAVEQGDAPVGAGAGQDAAGRQEPEILQAPGRSAPPSRRARPRRRPGRGRRGARCPRWSGRQACRRPFSRYFMSQICWEIAAIWVIHRLPAAGPERSGHRPAIAANFAKIQRFRRIRTPSLGRGRAGRRGGCSHFVSKSQPMARIGVIPAIPGRGLGRRPRWIQSTSGWGVTEAEARSDDGRASQAARGRTRR